MGPHDPRREGLVTAVAAVHVQNNLACTKGFFKTSFKVLGSEGSPWEFKWVSALDMLETSALESTFVCFTVIPRTPDGINICQGDAQVDKCPCERTLQPYALWLCIFLSYIAQFPLGVVLVVGPGISSVISQEEGKDNKKNPEENKTFISLPF